MRSIALATTLCIASIGIAPPPAAAQGAESFEQLRAQGKLYFKRGMYKQAMATFDKAWASKAGQSDFETALFRARTAYELLLLEVAFETIERAVALAEAPRDRQAAEDFRGEMASLYGALNVKAEEGETNAKGRIFFESKTGLINKEKKARFEAIRSRFRETDIALPRTVFLPYGEYTANNVPFALVQGEPPPTVSIFLQVRKGEEEDDGSMLWWYVGGGAAVVAVGVGAALLLSEPDPEIRDGYQVRTK